MAEDAVHNAFLNLTTHMADIGEPDSLQTKRYLITVAKNAAVDLYRKKSVRIQREIYMDIKNIIYVPLHKYMCFSNVFLKNFIPYS